MDLAAGWVKDAKFLREHGASEAAATTEKHAEQLTEAVAEAEHEILTLDEAASVSKYSKRRLRELVADGSISNYGRKGAPRIRRADLPRKPQVASNGFDAGAEASSILGSGR